MTQLQDIISASDRHSLEAYLAAQDEADDETWRIGEMADVENTQHNRFNEAEADAMADAADKPRKPRVLTDAKPPATCKVLESTDVARTRQGVTYTTPVYKTVDVEIDLADPALDLMSFRQESIAACQGFMHYAKLAIQQFDFHPSLEILQLKLFDGLAHMLEMIETKNEQDGKEARAEYEAHCGAFDGTELWGERELELQRRLNGMRVQWAALNPAIEMAIKEREMAVGRSGINWGQYLRVKELAEARRRRRENQATATAWAKKTPAQRARALDRAMYEPQHNGIDAANQIDAGKQSGAVG